MTEDAHKYDGILYQERPRFSNHPPMSMESRAAQFSPFAALTGHEEAIAEVERETDTFTPPDPDTQALLNQQMQILMEHATEHPQITVCYFVPDTKKSGGAYITRTGALHRIDLTSRTLYFTDHTKVLLDRIVSLSSNLFPKDEPID